MMKRSFTIAAVLFLISCGNNELAYDASGTFEAGESTMTAEATGIIKMLDLEEGQLLKDGQFVGYIDTTQLYRKKKQLDAQIAAVLEKKPDVSAQVAAYRE